jgi:hypothetical protein
VSRLPKEEAPVSARRACADPASLDDDDARPALRQEAGRGAARETRPDDDRVGGQLSEGSTSSSDFRLRQNMSPPTRAASVATIAAVFGTREPARGPGTAALAFDFMARFTIGRAAV